MVSSTHLEPVVNTYLFLTNILSGVKIDKLVVPELVVSGCAAVLECQYSGTRDDVTVLWLLNGSQVHQWRRGADPRASGLLDGRLDLTYGLSLPKTSDGVERHALRVVDVSPELSGDYTCAVRSGGREARATAAMLVYSPEQDFQLTFSALEPDVVDVKCSARHLYPQPELTIEYDKVPIAQHLRIWREGAYFEASSSAALQRGSLQPRAALACRLRLPQLDYTAITHKYLHFDSPFSGGSIVPRSHFVVGLFILILHNVISVAT